MSLEKEKINVDIAVIGGGAAGLAAAVSYAKKTKNSSIVIIEKEKRVGKKLLATGNGRCNLTNKNMSAEFYNGSCKKIAADIIKKYNTSRIISFFNSLGIECKSDSQGRFYPYSEQAASVLDLLRFSAQRLGVEEVCETEITDFTPIRGGFKLTSPDKIILAEKVILSAGGAASPKLGSDGSSYRFAEMLGLKCMPVFPSLAPIKVDNDFMPFLKGIRTAAEVSLVADGAVVKSELGELQLTQNALSGICIFQLSRFVNEFFVTGTVDGKKVKNISVSIDLLPDYSYDEVERLLYKRRKRLSFLTLEEFFTGLLNKKIGQCLFKELKILPLKREVSSLSLSEIELLANILKSWKFKPSQRSDMGIAQVTAGGIHASEIDRNMRSVKYRNLYIAGEALDIDGLCGGYNLHWAFASGIVAGTSAAEK